MNERRPRTAWEREEDRGEIDSELFSVWYCGAFRVCCRVGGTNGGKKSPLFLESPLFKRYGI